MYIRKHSSVATKMLSITLPQNDIRKFCVTKSKHDVDRLVRFDRAWSSNY